MPHTRQDKRRAEKNIPPPLEGGGWGGGGGLGGRVLGARTPPPIPLPQGATPFTLFLLPCQATSLWHGPGSDSLHRTRRRSRFAAAVDAVREGGDGTGAG